MTGIAWPELHRHLPAAAHGAARVEHFRVHGMEMMRAAMKGDRYAFTDPQRTYVKLTLKGELQMSDTDMELATCAPVVHHAHGDVLVAGLGLGLILHPIAAKGLVTSITVVEVSPDVIALVAPSLPPQVRVVQDDIFAWLPAQPRGAKYDTIWFDIWPTRCVDNLTDIARLKRLARRFYRPGTWCRAWYEEELRDDRRASRSRSRYW